MESVVRAAVLYLSLMVVIRLAGARSLAQITTFDFVLLLIIGEAAQQALLGDDYSITNAVLAVVTLIAIEIFVTRVQLRRPSLRKWLEGAPIVLVDNGQPLQERMRAARVEVEDVLEAARSTHGLERLDQVKYAVLEASGGISIIPHR